MNQIIEGTLKLGNQVTVQKESEVSLFTMMTREVTAVIGGMAYVKDCGWFFIDNQ
jgi:hypothetical protein